MNSGGAYYNTAVDLRRQATTARANYPEALERTQSAAHDLMPGRAIHAAALIVQAVGFELAASLYCIAQAIEDHR